MELFSSRILDYAVCYCRVPICLGQYAVPALLFFPTPLVPEYYTGLVLKRSADDRTRVWTIALTEYIFLTGTVLAISANDRVCAGYYTDNQRFDHVTGSLLFDLLV